MHASTRWHYSQASWTLSLLLAMKPMQLMQCNCTLFYRWNWINKYMIKWKEGYLLTNFECGKITCPCDHCAGPWQSCCEGGPAHPDDKSLVAGLLWWGGRERGAILTDLWPPMTCIVYSAWVYSSVCSHFFTFTLMTSGAFSQSVSKLFWTQSW